MEDSLNVGINSSNKFEDEDLSIASKNWNRLVTAASTIGYKEGIEDGQEAVFQEGFDKGYIDGFNVAFTLGRYKGLISSTQNARIPSDVNDILKETKKGLCYICDQESQNKHKKSDKLVEDTLFSDVLQKQQMYSTNILEKLHKDYERIAGEDSINVNELVTDT